MRAPPTRSTYYARCKLVGVSIVLEGFASAPLSTYLEVRAAAPVRSYCLTVQTDLIGPATLNGALPKHDDMQAVAYVPEMSHFHAQMGRIFVDQLMCCTAMLCCYSMLLAKYPTK
jgi:hypothetical protein